MSKPSIEIPCEWRADDPERICVMCGKKAALDSMKTKLSRKDELAAMISGHMEAMRPLLAEWTELNAKKENEG